MMNRVFLRILVFVFIGALATASNSQEKNDRWDELKAVDGLPFCAFILGNWYDNTEQERTIDVLMEANKVNESNLYLLFGTLSEKYARDPVLKIWVNTSVTQLATLATGTGGSGPSKSKRVHQLAYYRR